jgi:hypothetical protein
MISLIMPPKDQVASCNYVGWLDGGACRLVFHSCRTFICRGCCEKFDAPIELAFLPSLKECAPALQVARVQKMLGDEFGTASNIKNRVNRQSVLGAITSAQQRLKLYNKASLQLHGR